MKTIISVLMLTALICGCNSNQSLTDKQKVDIKALAEVKYRHCFNYYNELKFDSITNAFSKDAYIMVDGRLISHENLRTEYEGWSKSAKSLNVKIDSLYTKVILNNAVLITCYFSMKYTDTANYFTFAKGYQSVLLNPTLKEGYISHLTETNDYSPVEYAEDIAPQFTNPAPNLNWRHNFAQQQFQHIWIYNIGYQKQKGIPAEKASEAIINSVLSSWDKTRGFDGLCKNVIFICQSLWNKSKILQRDNNALKIELSKDHKALLKFVKITDEEAVISHITAWKIVSEHMGANFAFENKENSFTMTFTRK